MDVVCEQTAAWIKECEAKLSESQTSMAGPSRAASVVIWLGRSISAVCCPSDTKSLLFVVFT